ncbi:hypothetical protein GCM10022415_00390 [Knoellia locipacati]|uniref:histidine kinase n=1 Tax=Knoellia locipacati TaxID=882824 RepID=A0A512SVM4_9MICO|nr:hypothetical protein KLO01_00390 [Knoellia locipacati]
MVGVVSVALGVLSEGVGYGWGDPLLWAPDLVIGLVWAAAGLRLWTSRPRAAALAWGVSATWYLGSLLPIGVFWHRALLIHVLVLLAAPRPNRWARVVVLGGYLASLSPVVWRAEESTMLVAAVLLVLVLGVAPRGRGAGSPLTRTYQTCLVVTLLVLLVSAVVRSVATDPGRGALPTLLAYEAALAVVALVLLATGDAADSDSVVDRVLELNDGPGSSLRDALADVLEDPGLEVGYWRDHDCLYSDLEGRAVVPPPAGHRVALPIDRDGRPVALVVHAASLQGDPRLKAAVAVATRLVTANAELSARVDERRADLAASRLRLVQSADGERAQLAAQLRRGPLARLTALGTMLDAGSEPQPLLAEAFARVQDALEDLGRWERGLHPRELDNGLGPALTSLAGLGSVPVTVSVSPGRFPRELEAAVYYVCAEALSNVAKHAAARHVTVDVALGEDRLCFTVVDDGSGGAVPTGTGLQGARDRLEAFGGTFTVTSVPGAGTTLSGTVPMSPEDGPAPP